LFHFLLCLTGVASPPPFAALTSSLSHLLSNQATLKAQSRFHDPTRSSLHSHTQSSSAFLSWSSSASNPSSSRPTTPPSHSHQHHHQPFDETLAFTVKASLADEESEVEGEVLQNGPDGVRYRESRVEGLVTPPVDKGGRRVRYCVLEVSLQGSEKACTGGGRVTTASSMSRKAKH
jgi:hypothetical protein